MEYNEENLNQLREILSPPPLIIGIGNELRGDDGAGIILIEKLRESGYPSLLNVYSNPENYLRKIAEIEKHHRLWVDVINWDAPPGDFRIFDSSEIKYFAISTHNFSPAVLLEFLKEYRNIPDYFLGIQPKNMQLGQALSSEVEETVEFLRDFIVENMNQKRR
ncbi:MAG: hydrogenase maturation protease [Calditrichaeota bacterium]|nr:hydrogenase maturation protease [Calditrichota bacterium]RQV98799.1 MAG: hydrogenase maturation protease [Calditrichota bacterium]